MAALGMPEQKQKQGLVFISCGQFTAAEITLGQNLAKAVTDLTEFEGYFAQNEASLEGLSRNILGTLNRCCGFVAVMHHRGRVQTPHGEHIRGSVWVEQEIAIAAFLQQAQSRNLEVAVYIERGIKREGVRDQLHLNPVEFESEDEVLHHFRKRISDGLFRMLRSYLPKQVELRLDYKTLSRGGGAVHQYELYVFVKNTGTEPLHEYWLELLFPNTVLDQSTTYHVEVKDRRTPTHRFFRSTQASLRKVIYPDDEILAFSIDYYMNHDILLHKSSVLDAPILVAFGAPGMAPTKLERPFRDFQIF